MGVSGKLIEFWQTNDFRKRQAVALVRTVDLQANRAVRVGSERGCNEDQGCAEWLKMCVDMLSPSDPTSALAGAAEVENSDSILRGYSGGPQFGGPAADKPGRPASERATKIALIPVPED